MNDADAEFDKAFEGFGEDPKPTPPVEPPKDPATPPATPPVVVEPPKADEPKPPEESKKDEPVTPPIELPKEEGKEATPPAADEEKPKEGAEPPKDPATPPEEPKPLTKDDVTSIIQNIQTSERASSKEIENTTNEVLEAYYPDGLSNVLTTPEGKELKTPQDVVDASGGEMTTEQAAQWLMNEQYKLDAEVSRIKDDAKKIAETTISFKRDSVAALQKYEPLFKWQPSLQGKVFDKLMKMVKADEKKGVILASPDVMDHYDFYLEPYQKAYEFATKQSATNPTPPANPETPPVTPGAEDRLDEGGDGGASPVDDPNDFAQQVGKELAKGM